VFLSRAGSLAKALWFVSDCFHLYLKGWPVVSRAVHIASGIKSAMTIWWLFAAVAGTSLFMTWVLRRYALASSLMDIPNERSSHSVPTPRGGGVAIVLSFLLALPFLAFFGALEWFSVWGLLVSGALVAVVGFLDDHGHIAARWRLLAHFTAAIWALALLGGLPPIQLGSFEFDLSWVGHILAAFYLVWMLNLYNFMDGIDGIASVEAICACLGACLIYWLTGNEGLMVAPMLLAMAVIGFLYWNFPPARIFMGDAGSGFLGLVLAILSLQAAWIDPALLWVWLILLGVFIVDATFTLGRRLLRGDKVYEAHRSHAYQFASRFYQRHLPVTLAVLVINVFWLLPIAVCVVWWKLNGLLGLIVAYVPLIVLAARFRAGELEKA
jgi:Fuc2NAc and GlcNAc transferase